VLKLKVPFIRVARTLISLVKSALAAAKNRSPRAGTRELRWFSVALFALLLVVRVERAQAEEPSTASTEEPEPIEVSVVGTKLQQTGGAAQVIGKEELERKELDDPHAVLGSVPGVQSRGEDGVGLRPNVSIRGVNPDRSKKVTLMEDGVLIAPAPYTAPAAYYFPLMTRMVGVRVIKGPAAISYGPQTVAGAIDLVTRGIPAAGSLGLDGALGQYGYRKLHGYAGTSDGRLGFLIEGVHLESSGFKTLPNGSDTGFSRNEWMAKVGFVPDPTAKVGQELQLKLTYSEELSNETYLGLSDADLREDPLKRYAASQLDQMRNTRTSVVLRHEIEPARELVITTDVYRHDFFRIWRKVNGFRGTSVFDVLTDPESSENEVFYAILRGELDASGPGEAILIGPNQREFVSEGLQSRLRLDGSTGPVSHRVEYGVRLHYDSVARRHSEDAFFAVSGALVPEGSPTIVTAFNEASTLALAVHASDAVTFGSLTVTPGVRFEAMSSRAEDHISNTTTRRLAQVVLPGMGVYYGVTPELGVLAGVHRGFSPPPPGSPESTESELSVNTEAGLRYSEGPLRAEAIGFYDDYENLTDICTLSSGCLDVDLDRQFDAGAATLFGIEALLGHDFDLGVVTLPVGAAYTFTRARFDSNFESQDPIFGEVESGDELPYVPRHQVHVDLGVENATFGANTSAHYVAAMREQAGSGSLADTLATDEQFTVDVGGFYQVLEPLRLYANVRNVTDAHFIVARRPYGARPNAPRWIQIGAKFEF
jgi:Fe(3+) dicitrate transport protein